MREEGTEKGRDKNYAGLDAFHPAMYRVEVTGALIGVVKGVVNDGNGTNGTAHVRLAPDVYVERKEVSQRERERGKRKKINKKGQRPRQRRVPQGRPRSSNTCDALFLAREAPVVAKKGTLELVWKALSNPGAGHLEWVEQRMWLCTPAALFTPCSPPTAPPCPPRERTSSMWC